jgi:hypothetical protein
VFSGIAKALEHLAKQRSLSERGAFNDPTNDSLRRQMDD